MKKKKMLLALLLAGVFACAPACGERGEPGGENMKAEVTVKSALNTVKVLRDEDISDLAPASLKFEAAKGETEGAQLVLRASGADVATYDVSVGELKKANGKTIPASAVSVYALRYMHITSGFTGFPAGTYPDAMIPWEFTKIAKENKLEKDLNQGLWFDLKVPEGAEAGIYTGTVKITADGKVQSVPVTLEVFDFDMPEQPAIRTTYLIWQDWLIDGELDNTIEKYKDYYDFLLDYNATAYYFPADTGDIEGFVACLREYYDKVASYGIPYTRATTVIDGKNCESVDFDQLEAYLSAIMEASIADGVNYFDKAYYYFDKVYDEITEERYAQMDYAIRTVNEREAKVIASAGIENDSELAESARNIRHLMSVVGGWKDIFEQYDELTICPLFNNLVTTKNIEEYQTLMEQGYDITSYGAASFWPFSAHLIDDYMLTTRDVFWSKFEYGLSGDLIWNVNAYCNFGTVLPIGYGRVTDFYTQSSRDGVTAGDGYLLYPGRPYGSENPFPSLRLTALRDGIDDYTYLDTLQKEYEKLAKEYGVSADGVHDVIAQINSQIYAKGVSKLNFSGLQDVRRTVARLIELAKSEVGLLLTEFSTDETGVNYTFTAKDGAVLSLNGETLTGETTPKGSGRSYSATDAAYPDSGALEISVSGIAAGEVSLYVGKAPEEVLPTETAADLEKLSVYSDFGSSLALNENPAFARSGNSFQVTLSGHVFDREADTTTFRPAVWFGVEGLDKMESFTFWLYNDGPAFEVMIVGKDNDTAMSYNVDTVVLKANAWNRITVDNFTMISRDSSVIAGIDELRITCANLIDGEGNAYARTLYLDSIFKKSK